MNNFYSFGLPLPLVQSLDRLQFTTPTPIQMATIPLALKGHDILGSAQTGTGKTAAFGIPLIAKLLSNPQGSALVITPTRELATQVMQSLKDLLGKTTPIKTALLIGGEAMPKQFQQLRMQPRLFVGTPGRINDHLTRGTLKLQDTSFLVLDETDRMLDMGFSIQIEKIRSYLPKQRQTLLFSATLPQNIVKLAASYLTNPERISMGATSNPAANIKQEMLPVSEADKYPQLLTQLEKREGSVIVFIKTKHGAEKMAKRLRDDHHSVDALHGDLRHNKRESVIKAFRNSKYRILVATDVASRGLDIPHIEHVINYDLPQCPEDYIHRIGRTARAGAEGEAICFVTPSDRAKWHAIDRLMNPNTAGPAPRSEPRRDTRGAPRRGDARPGTRSDARPGARRDTRGDTKRDTNRDTRPGTRTDGRQDSRQGPARESKWEPRTDVRRDPRADTRGDARPSTRTDGRQDSRQAPRQGAPRQGAPRQDSRPGARSDARPGTRSDARGDTRRDTGRENASPKKVESKHRYR